MTEALQSLPRAPGHAALLADVRAPERLSATTLRAAAKCLLAAYLARQTGNPSGEAATVGTLVHEVCAQVAFNARMLQRESFGPDEVERVAHRVLAAPERPEPLSPDSMQEVLRLCRTWAGLAHFPIAAEHYDVEVSARHELGGQVLSGRMDLVAVDGAMAEVTDWKTGRVVPSQSEVEREHVQLPTYAVYIQAEHPQVETFLLREVYIRRGAVREVLLTAADVARHRKWLMTTASRLRAAWAAQLFPPTPGRHCKYCSDPSACPLPEWARPESIDTEQQASAQLAAILVEEARLKTRKKSLRAFLERDEAPERVAAGDAGARLVTSEQRRMDKDAAKAAGIDLSRFEKPATRTTLKIDGT